MKLQATIIILVFVGLAFTGCISNPLTENNLSGNWQVMERGWNNETLQQYNLHIIHVGENIKFYKGSIEIGHGILHNQTISVTTIDETVWHDFGIIMVSITTVDELQATIETDLVKWMEFHRLVK